MKRSRFFYLATLMGSLLLAVVFLLANNTTARGADAAPEDAVGVMPPAASLAQPGQVGYLTGASAADPLTIVLGQLADNAAALGLNTSDLAGYEITDRYVTAHNGVTHIYLRQTFNGLSVHQALVSAHVDADGRLIALHSSFVPDLADRYVNQPVALSAVDAVQAAADHFGLNVTESVTVLSASDSRDQAVVLSDAGISQDPIPARLMLQYTDAGDVRQVWNVVINENSSLHWWDAYVDAATGRVLAQNDWVVNENLADHVDGAAATVDDGQSETAAAGVNRQAAGASDDYFVIPLPYESPNHFDGDYGMTTPGSLEDSPADLTASPFGWHDTDGNAGAEYTITQGNNVLAATDLNADNVPDPGSQPDGGANLIFNIPADFSLAPSGYRDAAVINLFYFNNIVHDVLYHYGFDEPSGNFQEFNYTATGLGSDSVNADAQDGSGTNNANFGTPGDGSNPRMQMYVWTAPNPDRDSDFDNGVIAHEYGHGVSNRLTAGPSQVGCLGNSEQMGEGWSDYIALFLTDDGVTVDRGIGTYVFNQDVDGVGIRPTKYSPNMAVNPTTYGDIGSLAVPHGVGYAWATMLWDMQLNLEDEYGFDSNLYTGTGGNNIAFQLVMDGMKLQPCAPGFVDGRDAIIQADIVNNGGANYCTIWSSFANRGLGWSASQGSSSSTSDGTEAFDMPPGCVTMDALPDAQNVCAGATADIAVVVGSSFAPPVTLSVLSGAPAGSTINFTPNPVTVAPSVASLEVGVPGAATGGTYTLTIQGTDAFTLGGGTTHTTTTELNVVENAPGAPTLTSPADTATDVEFDPTFTWTASAGTDVYHLEVATDAGFGTIVVDEMVGGTSYAMTDYLPHSTTFYWRVTPINTCGTGTASATFSFTTITPIECTGGLNLVTLNSYDFDSGAQGWTHSGNGDTWALVNSLTEGGGQEWHADDPETLSDQRLISPDIVLPIITSNQVVRFDNLQFFETPNTDGRCWDAGIFEVSVNGGSTWSYVPNDKMITDPYNNVIWNDQAGNNPITNSYGAVQAWCDEDGPWAEAYVDVSEWGGQSVRFALRLGSDSAAGNDGWNIDNFEVLACSAGINAYLPVVLKP